VTGEVQEATPDVGSVPAQLTWTAWLYQPFTSAVRPGVAVTVGGVSSNLSGKETVELVFPALSVQLPFGAAEPLSGPL
jgi:hypothetical protein